MKILIEPMQFPSVTTAVAAPARSPGLGRLTAIPLPIMLRPQRATPSGKDESDSISPLGKYTENKPSEMEALSGRG